MVARRTASLAANLPALIHFAAAQGVKVGPIRPADGAEAIRAAPDSGTGVSLIAEIGGLSRSLGIAFKLLKKAGAVF